MQFRGGMQELMRQANRVQRKIEERREELKDQEFQADAGGGRVEAVVNGGAEVVRVGIDPALFGEEDREMVEDLVAAAVNAALAKARETVDAEIEKVSGGLKIPGVG
ncbi:MAG: YbaB/EbfC family nucleoid-associated protein [Myxococcota bacterium]